MDNAQPSNNPDTEEERRQWQVQKLLQKRRLLKAELNVVQKEIDKLCEKKSRFISPNKPDLVAEIESAMKKLKDEQTKLLDAVAQVDYGLAALMPEQLRQRFQARAKSMV